MRAPRWNGWEAVRSFFTLCTDCKATEVTKLSCFFLLPIKRCSCTYTKHTASCSMMCILYGSGQTLPKQ